MKTSFELFCEEKIRDRKIEEEEDNLLEKWVKLSFDDKAPFQKKHWELHQEEHDKRVGRSKKAADGTKTLPKRKVPLQS